MPCTAECRSAISVDQRRKHDVRTDDLDREIGRDRSANWNPARIDVDGRILNFRASGRVLMYFGCRYFRVSGLNPTYHAIESNRTTGRRTSIDKTKEHDSTGASDKNRGVISPDPAPELPRPLRRGR